MKYKVTEIGPGPKYNVPGGHHIEKRYNVYRDSGKHKGKLDLEGISELEISFLVSVDTKNIYKFPNKNKKDNKDVGLKRGPS